MKRFLGVAVRCLVSGLLIFILAVPASRFISPRLPLVDITALPATLAAADPAALAGAVLLALASVLFIAGRWWLLVGSRSVPYHFLLRLTFIGIFFNNFLPTGAGGDLVKGYYLLHGRSGKLDLGLSIVMDRLVGVFSIMTLGYLAVIVNFDRLPGAAAWTVTAIFLALLFFLLLLAWRGLAVRLARRLGLEGWGRFGALLKRVYQGGRAYLEEPARLLGSLACSFGSQGLQLAAFYLVARALGTPVTFVSLCAYVPLVWSFALVPSLGGLGARETAYTLFFQGQMGRENALALGLIILGLTLTQSLVGGLLYFLGGGRWKTAS
ncbi:MAG TPA: lysylphosphatidylglycerol synthase transmembrane domain-containing protein [bacterium]|uniref:Flippase-like domain-containing protein n=1 Tax=candidate division TA06 bacterium ADurb.Bin417 TaxID=1852828 RepID=A0A1V5MIP0_UNCT6|nr:MAG: hypothetical protein BWY73_00481 [candidate division TA06 bacterium ADurb.Bin417]HNQ34517.1 lysylphosphatidylglycerol synthase transmembrane domain-containing protein [bacterium]HNS48037.1 lysylphosphatidylglycerol synthase transmembrane domain-containing protein [bacterium]